MGFRALVIILIISTFSIGCSSINFSTMPENEVLNYSMFNHLCSNNNSVIIFLDGKKVESKYVNVKGDSLYYFSGIDTLSIPLSVVEKVITKQLGGAVGFGIFFGTGYFLLSGNIASYLAGGGLGGGLFGATIGLGVGLATLILILIFGGETEYIFNEKVNNQQIEYYKNYHKRKAKKDSINLGS